MKESQKRRRRLGYTIKHPIGNNDRMVSLVSQMLDLNKKVQVATLDHDKTLLKRQVEATDAAIDTLVYELYGLTEEEIGIVEGAGN